VNDDEFAAGKLRCCSAALGCSGKHLARAATLVLSGLMRFKRLFQS
jgi:hypothetical protein